MQRHAAAVLRQLRRISAHRAPHARGQPAARRTHPPKTSSGAATDRRPSRAHSPLSEPATAPERRPGAHIRSLRRRCPGAGTLGAHSASRPRRARAQRAPPVRPPPVPTFGRRFLAPKVVVTLLVLSAALAALSRRAVESTKNTRDEQRQNDAATSTTPYTNVVPAITAE